MRGTEALMEHAEIAVVQDYITDSAISAAVHGADVAIHLAARVHMMNDDAADPLAEFRRVNVEATRNLISQCADAGVKRFVFLSSVKAVGEGGPSAYVETDSCRPQDPYGVSKMEAEEAVRSIGRERGIETVILRPTVVYGPRVRANILRLMKLVRRGVPLPLGAVRNRRSLVYVGNLVSAIETCLDHPKAAGETFFVADEPPISTRDLVESLARHMDKPARLLPVPPVMLRGAGMVTGKGAEVDRLIGSLAVDTSKIRSTLDWTPPHSTEEGLRATVEWFLQDAAAQTK